MALFVLLFRGNATSDQPKLAAKRMDWQNKVNNRFHAFTKSRRSFVYLKVTTSCGQQLNRESKSRVIMRWSLTLVFFCLWSTTAFAQRATVTKNVNLRHDPSP